MVERRIKEAKFPAVKSLDSFDFAAIPSLNKTLVLELARSEYVTRRENIIAVGNSGTGKTHGCLGLGLAACQKGLSVGFNTAAALVHELLEARDEKRLLRLATSGWREDLIKQWIVFWFEWIDERDALQRETILKIFGKQVPDAHAPCRSP